MVTSKSEFDFSLTYEVKRRKKIIKTEKNLQTGNKLTDRDHSEPRRPSRKREKPVGKPLPVRRKAVSGEESVRCSE